MGDTDPPPSTLRSTRPRFDVDPTPEQLSAMAERFPSLRGLAGIRPWRPIRLAAAFRRRYDDAAGAVHVEGGRAVAALAILFRLDPEIEGHALLSSGIEAILEVEPAALMSWWNEAHWRALMAIPLRWRRLR